MSLYLLSLLLLPDLHHISSQYASTLLNKPHNRTPKTLRDLLSGAPPDAIDLLEKLMVFNPDKRLTAEQALRHPYVARWVWDGLFGC